MTLFDRTELGVAVVGAGRIGTHRSRLAAQHPAVRFLAISDAEPERAKALGERVGAQVASGSNEEVISHPDVGAVMSRPQSLPTWSRCSRRSNSASLCWWKSPSP